mmetsp:Transcript_18423/g.37261  ORF Transcript_18423/g.37261 Transcript_18423/m.37261 type:complete len:252 (-) Transcript_18423:1480-2235(-)
MRIAGVAADKSTVRLEIQHLKMGDLLAAIMLLANTSAAGIVPKPRQSSCEKHLCVDPEICVRLHRVGKRIHGVRDAADAAACHAACHAANTTIKAAAHATARAQWLRQRRRWHQAPDHRLDHGLRAFKVDGRPVEAGHGGAAHLRRFEAHGRSCAVKPQLRRVEGAHARWQASGLHGSEAHAHWHTSDTEFDLIRKAQSRRLLRGGHARLHQLLPLVIKGEIVEYGRAGLVLCEDLEHLAALLRQHLLSVT